MIIVTGSLAFDHIMDFPGRFSEHILPEKIHILNVSFLVDTLKRQRGGVAGNIAHNLALLGERPVILAAAGEDFQEYSKFLSAEGIDLSHVRIIPGDYTASAFITTDLADNQITGFYPGAMGQADLLSLKDFDPKKIELVLIAADKPSVMVKYSRECQELGIPYIFDPSQQIVRLSNEELRIGIQGAKVLIGNDYEIQLILNRFKATEEDLLKQVTFLISTLGEKGSHIHTRYGVVEIPIAKPNEITDPTGAGDAYRAGIIKGMIHNWPLEVMGRVAALSAVYAIESYGAQEHRYTKSEFVKRYQENFGAEIEL
ncbi:carbohydrate kinase family protein [Candidatus Acetothermia bacterium]|nr:carbohydrate kinase family protein [Candidatus Acetothermia bacterium]MBI3642810.1 carbohydrate kinase family protein [Candidatus Acetothermia bacterium]